jgi:hypothetical protein
MLECRPAQRFTKQALAADGGCSMTRIATRTVCRWAAAAAAGILGSAALASAGSAQATGVGGSGTHGAFQLCLDAEAKGWLDTRVALVVNDDPAAGKIDDVSVAQWATQTLKTCAVKAGGADAATEELFMRYMAHWREHIDRAAQVLRRQDRPD